MRLLYLTEEAIPFSASMVRGGAIHVRNVVEGLRERGHEVHLVDWNESPTRPYQHSIDPQTRFLDGPTRTTIQAVRTGRREGVDAVVSKTRKTYIPGYIAATLLGVPHVVHVGSSLTPPESGLLDRLSNASFTARLRVPHDGYLVVCEYIGNQLEARGVDPKVVFNVKNAVDTTQFHPEEIPVALDTGVRRRLKRIPERALRLGYIGGLQPYKGIEDLAKALEETDVPCHAIVAGDGPERERLAEAFGDDGTLLGSIPYEQVPALYHEFDAFVLPSYTEGLPRVVLEAQACGVAVVATNVGGVPEVLTDGETGVLYEPGNVQQLVDRIETLADRPGFRSKLGECGRASVAGEWTWEQLYSRYESALGTVIGND